jgi:hypothetical protein
MVVMESQQRDLNLNYVVPVVNTDGHVVVVSDQGAPTLLFFQTRNEHGDHLHADVVAAVRMNNISDAENLANAIKDTIKKHKDREP